MKRQLFALSALSIVSLAIGCVDSAGTSRPTTPPAPSTTERRPANVDVEVGRPGEKPAVDVDVKPGGSVNVDVDGEKIRERREERRAEREVNP